MVKKSFEFYEFTDSFLEKKLGKELKKREEKIERSNEMREKFNEEFHIKGRLEWIVDLYYEIDRYIMSLKNVRKEFLESYIKYSVNGLLFCYITIRKIESLKVWAKVSYTNLGERVPLFVRDYEPVSRRVGVLISFDDERSYLENKEEILKETFSIVEKAFQGMASQKRKIKTPLKQREEAESVKRREVEPVKLKPVEEFRPSLNLVIDNNGYIDVHFKIRKDQKDLLNRILQETIFK